MKPYRILAIALLFVGATVLPAAEVDANIPADADVVVSVNLEQLLNSPLGKKYLGTTIAEAIHGTTQGPESLKALGLDPLKDLRRITITLSSAAPEKGFVIIKGKFNQARIAELAEKAAALQKDKLKIDKSGSATVYEFPGEKPVFAHFVNDATLLLATSKLALIDPAKRGQTKKELAALIQQADDKQSAWLAALPAAANIAPAADNAQRQALEKLVAVHGVLKVSTSAKLELTLTAQDEQAAAAIIKMIGDFINTAMQFAPDAVKERPDLAPLFEVLKSITATAKGKGVRLTSELSAVQIEKMIKPAGADR